MQLIRGYQKGFAEFPAFISEEIEALVSSRFFNDQNHIGGKLPAIKHERSNYLIADLRTTDIQILERNEPAAFFQNERIEHIYHRKEGIFIVGIDNNVKGFFGGVQYEISHYGCFSSSRSSYHQKGAIIGVFDFDFQLFPIVPMPRYDPPGVDIRQKLFDE
jgi:hypothetical protein